MAPDRGFSRRKLIFQVPSHKKKSSSEMTLVKLEEAFSRSFDHEADGFATRPCDLSRQRCGGTEPTAGPWHQGRTGKPWPPECGVCVCAILKTVQNSFPLGRGAELAFDILHLAIALSGLGRAVSDAPFCNLNGPTLPLPSGSSEGKHLVWVWLKIQELGLRSLLSLIPYAKNLFWSMFLEPTACDLHSLRLTWKLPQLASANGTKSSKKVLGASMLVWGRLCFGQLLQQVKLPGRMIPW